MLRAGLETGYWMGLARRATTPLPSRHHLGPLLAMCPSTPPQQEAFVYSLLRLASSHPAQRVELEGEGDSEHGDHERPVL